MRQNETECQPRSFSKIVSTIQIVLSSTAIVDSKTAMNFFQTLTCILSILVTSSSSLFRKIVPIISEEYENCARPEEDYGAIDFSSYELIALNDYEVFVNGSVKMLKDIKGILPIHIFAERFERGQWVVMYYDTKRPNFCKSLKDPVEIWYEAAKDLKGCPLKPGVRSFVKNGENSVSEFLGRMEIRHGASWYNEIPIQRLSAR
jgi:hypothetical protein